MFQSNTYNKEHQYGDYNNSADNNNNNNGCCLAVIAPVCWRFGHISCCLSLEGKRGRHRGLRCYSLALKSHVQSAVYLQYGKFKTLYIQKCVNSIQDEFIEVYLK